MKDLNEVDAADVAGYAFTVEGYGGIAFRYVGPERVANADTEWTGLKVRTGNVIMVMVGDDREHVIDPADVSILDEDDYCHECGQIGCKGDGR